MKVLKIVFLTALLLLVALSCGDSNGSSASDVGFEEFQNEKAPKDTFTPKKSSSVHQENLNKVLLSYAPIVYGHEDKSEFLDNVVIDNLEKGLYFLYYLEKTNAEYLGKKGRYVKAQLQLDGDVGRSMGSGCFVLWSEKAYDLSNEEEQQTYLSLPIFPSNSYYKTDKWLDPIYNKFLSCLTKLSVNTPHKARIAFGFPKSRQKLDKQFTITITEDGKNAMLRMMRRITYERIKRIRMGNEGNMHNPENIEIVETIAKKKGYNVKRVVITGDKYNVYKNTTYPYAINNKACNAQLTYEKDGKCYRLSFQIVKDYQGGGNYGEPFIPFKRGDKEEILCRNVALKD